MSDTYFPTFKKLFNRSCWNQFRLRRSSRLNWRPCLAKSELPVEVQTTIRDVLRKTRLLRHEKSQVCDELIAHFHDGHAADKNYAELINTFGDQTVAARLIRRSKIRNRSAIVQTMQAAKWCSLGLLVSCVGITLYFLAGSPNPNVDYLPQLNQTALTASESDKAWPIYRDAWIGHDFLDQREIGRFRKLFLIDDTRTSQRLIKPSDPSWPEAVQYLTDRRDLLNAFRAASKKPVLGLELKLNNQFETYSLEDRRAFCPQEFDDAGRLLDNTSQTKPGALGNIMADGLWGVRLPHIQGLRTVARFLAVDTRLAFEQNDQVRGIENIEAIFGVALQASESPLLVCGMTGLEIDQIGFDLIEETITEHPEFLTTEQIERLQTLVANLPIRNMIKFDGEHAAFYDFLQRIYTDDGNGDGRITLQGLRGVSSMATLFRDRESGNFNEQAYTVAVRALSAPLKMVTMPSRKEIIEKHEQIIDDINETYEQPIGTLDFDARSLLINEQIGDDSSYPLLGLFLPAFDSIRILLEKELTRQNAVEIALAAEGFRRETGEWPANADELAPKFLETLPLDPLSQQPLKLAVIKDQLTIYSVGNNLQDDGGTPLTDPTSGQPVEHFAFESNALFPYSGDWILWPSHRREE